MRGFILKCLLLVCVLFVGVVIGMNKANQGMKEMKGYDDTSFQSPVLLQQTEDGKVEASVLGREIVSHDFEKKKEKLEEIKTFNIFSEAGKALAKTVTAITQALFDVVTGLF